MSSWCWSRWRRWKDYSNFCLMSSLRNSRGRRAPCIAFSPLGDIASLWMELMVTYTDLLSSWGSFILYFLVVVPGRFVLDIANRIMTFISGRRCVSVSNLVVSQLWSQFLCRCLTLWGKDFLEKRVLRLFETWWLDVCLLEEGIVACGANLCNWAIAFIP